MPETMSTLRFGTRAKAIKNKPKINKEHTIEELKSILVSKEREIEQLKEMVEKLKDNQNVSICIDSSEKFHNDKDDMIQELQEELQDKKESFNMV